MLVIDGSLGEGGGQVLRTSLSCAAILQKPFRLVNIRAKRSKPGLRPQHLTAVRAVGRICNAYVQGDVLNSTTLEFTPQTRPQGGTYVFNVSDAAEGGSAGAVSLILQAILWPLLFAETPSTITLQGGTFVPFSPPIHYLTQVALPAFARMGVQTAVNLQKWGWFPAGGGSVQVTIQPLTHLKAAENWGRPTPDSIGGIAAVTNLPAHIPNRMARRAHNLLAEAHLKGQIEELRDTGNGMGAGFMLWVTQGGFSSLGRKGLPADEVSAVAVHDLLAFLQSKTDCDVHLTDQLLLPMALAHGTSTFTAQQISQHTLTNAALLRQWLDCTITIRGDLNQPGQIDVSGIQHTTT